MSDATAQITPETVKPSRLAVLTLFVAPVLLVVLSLAQYMDHDFHTLMGDDLANLSAIAAGEWASDLRQMLFGVAVEKWRPVFQTVMGLLFGVFGFKIQYWIAFNILLHTASALVLYLIVLRLAPGRPFLAFTVALLFATTRFADYQLWQVTGLVEGLSTFLFLAAINSYVIALQGRTKAMWTALGLWAAAFLTHERYLVFFPVVLMAAFFWPAQGQRITRIWYAVVALAVVLIHFGYRAALGERLLVGTGGQEIGLDFSRIATFFVTAIVNALGFNYGPAYLAHQPMREAPAYMFGVSIVIAVVTLAAILIGLVLARRKLFEKPKRLAPLLLLAACIGGAALVASITFRQEFRWILTVYLFLLVAFALGIAAIGDKRIGMALAAVLLAASLFQTDYYRKLDNNVVFFSLQRNVDQIHDLISSAPPANGGTYLVVEDPAAQCDWGYGRGRLLKIYDDIKSGQFSCVQGIANLPAAAALPDTRIIVSRLSDGVTRDVTASAKGQLALASVAVDASVPLVPAFDPKMLNSQAPVSTPTNLGAFTGEWQTDLGGVPSLVIVSGYNVTMPVTQPAPGSQLVFVAGMPYRTSEEAQLWVAAVGRDGVQRRLWEANMRGPADSVARLSPVKIALDGDIAALVFGINSPFGDTGGHWAVFGSPAIVPASAAAADSPPAPACNAVAAPENDRTIVWCR